jgi:competence ComEA-like helix-hairpin-helix protein
MPENLYTALSPYIQLPAKNKTPAEDIAAIVAGKNPAPNQAGSAPKKHTGTLDINRASIAEWQQLKGIGPAFAKRIVAFRDKLGGFYTVGQVAETFGLPDSTFQQIKPQLVPSQIVNKIKINTVSLEVLMTHPYIKRNIAQIILNYRAQHGPFAAPEDLYRIHALSKEAATKIIPYISTE